MIRVRSSRKRDFRRWWLPFFGGILIIVLVAMYFIPLPYYIYAPGSAEVLQPLIRVEGGHKTERGSFMLTSVYVVYADNIYDFLYGLMLPHHEIMSESDVAPGLTDNQYNDIEIYMMQQAHQDAVVAALRYLRLPIKMTTEGVDVVYLENASRANGVLRGGDVLTAINGKSLRDTARLFTAIENARVGQRVWLDVLRNGKKLHVRVPLISLPSLPGQKKPRAGIGLVPADAVDVHTPYHIVINSGDLSGPSAGFMFSLEIVNQLYKGGDLTKGYAIAGTGTIDANGVIGQIGGVAHKVIAAMRAGADYFFVPADVQPGDTNEAHAISAVRSLNTKMRVIPVHTLAQAIAFLKRLPPKFV